MVGEAEQQRPGAGKPSESMSALYSRALDSRKVDSRAVDSRSFGSPRVESRTVDSRFLAFRSLDSRSKTRSMSYRDFMASRSATREQFLRRIGPPAFSDAEKRKATVPGPGAIQEPRVTLQEIAGISPHETISARQTQAKEIGEIEAPAQEASDGAAVLEAEVLEPGVKGARGQKTAEEAAPEAQALTTEEEHSSSAIAETGVESSESPEPKSLEAKSTEPEPLVREPEQEPASNASLVEGSSSAAESQSPARDALEAAAVVQTAIREFAALKAAVLEAARQARAEQAAKGLETAGLGFDIPEAPEAHGGIPGEKELFSGAVAESVAAEPEPEPEAGSNAPIPGASSGAAESEAPARQEELAASEPASLEAASEEPVGQQIAEGGTATEAVQQELLEAEGAIAPEDGLGTEVPVPEILVEEPASFAAAEPAATEHAMAAFAIPESAIPLEDATAESAPETAEAAAGTHAVTESAASQTSSATSAETLPEDQPAPSSQEQSSQEHHGAEPPHYGTAQPASPEEAQKPPASSSRAQLISRWFALERLFASPGASPELESLPGHEHHAPVFAVFSFAGGAGKTSLIATLGRALAGRGEQVLLAETTFFGLLPFYFGGRDLKPGILRTFTPPEKSGRVPVQIITLDSETLRTNGAGEEGLSKELLVHGQDSQRILVDLQTASRPMARRVRPLTPTVLIPLLPEMSSVASVRETEALFSYEGGAPPFYLLNQFDASSPLHLDLRRLLSERLGERLLPFVLRRSREVSEALAEGMTVIDYAPESPIAADYLALADWMGKVSPSAADERGARWSERLLSGASR